MQTSQAPKTMTGQLLAATAMLLVLAALMGRQAQVLSAPVPDGSQNEASDLDDLGDDLADSPQPPMGKRQNQESLDGAEFGQAAGSGGNFNNDMGQQQYQNFKPQQRQRYGHGAAGGQSGLEQQASENNENSSEDNETDADDDSDFGAMGLTSANAGAASHGHAGYRPWAPEEASGLEAAGASSPASSLNFQGEADVESVTLDNSGEPDGLDSNIANAKIEMSPRDMATAAGHHHHHGHYVHGWLKMGAETGKKGAFKWHDKHPVGGKGRR